MSLYIYPKLSGQDFAFVRMGGPGLANCLFIAARAAILAQRLPQAILLRPTWERLGIGQLIRHEKDKRFYRGLFKKESFWQTIRRFFICKLRKTCPEDNITADTHGVVVVSGLRNYFSDLWSRADFVRAFFFGCIESDAIQAVPVSMKKSIAVHVRLGDFPPHYRTAISWYQSILKKILALVGNQSVDIQLFSDGTDAELAPLLELKGVHRVFYGNALADIVAMSRCGFLVGSDSTFSGWGAFLGNVPGVYAHLQDCRPLEDASQCVILTENDVLPDHLKRILSLMCFNG